MSLSSFKPYAKNPAISKVFREISMADELGSGMRNTYKYTKLYSGGEPEFIEGDVFRTIVPLNDVSIGVVGPRGTTDQDTNHVTDQDTNHDDRFSAIIEFCSIPRSRTEIQEFLGLSNRGHFKKSYLMPLIESGKLKRTVPDKPSSKNQKYIKA